MRRPQCTTPIRNLSMFVNLPDRFLNNGSRDVPRRPPLPDGGGAARIDPDLIAQLIPLIAGAIVFTAATLANLACDVLGLGHAQAIPATRGVAGVAAVIAYGVFQQGDPLEPAKLKGRAFDARAVAQALGAVFILLFAL